MTAKKTATKKRGRAVVVTDKYRGIVFGYLVEESETWVRLKDARHAYTYYSVQGHPGVTGLASGGPGPKSRIGPRINGKFGEKCHVWDCSPEAVERWEAASWV